MQGDVVTVVRVIPASPEAIFALLSDATEHPRIDGSGSVVRARPGSAEHLSLGSKFGMSMKMGVPYAMANTVVEYEENRRIAWQTRPPGIAGKLLAGRIWRYELEPAGDGSTRVRESWDISEDKQKFLLRLSGFPAKTKSNMDKTLERIEEITTRRTETGTI